MHGKSLAEPSMNLELHRYPIPCLYCFDIMPLTPTSPVNIPFHAEPARQPENREARFNTIPNQATPQTLHKPPPADARPEKSALKRHATDPVPVPPDNPDAIKRAFTEPLRPMAAATAKGNAMKDYCLKALSEDSNSASSQLLNKLASTPSRFTRGMSSDQAKTLQQIRNDLRNGKPTDFQELKKELKGKDVQRDEA